MDQSDLELQAYLESQEEESDRRTTIFKQRLKERFDATKIKATERERSIILQWVVYGMTSK